MHNNLYEYGIADKIIKIGIRGRTYLTALFHASKAPIKLPITKDIIVATEQIGHSNNRINHFNNEILVKKARIQKYQKYFLIDIT